MRFILYLELGTRNIDASVSDVLLFPSERLIPDHAKWTAKWWGDGHTRTMRSDHREPILRRVYSERFNELELRFQAEESSREQPHAAIVRGWLQMYPSSFSAMWAQVASEKLTSPLEERRRKTFIAAESAVWKRRFRRPYPSLLECSELEIDLDSDVSDDDELQSIAVEIIQDAMPSALACQDIFGYGCLRGACRKQTMLNNLGDIPEAVDSLGDRFENIYPILIGSTGLCEELASRLDGFGKVVPFGAESRTSILSIPPSRIEQAKAVSGIESCIIDLKSLAESYRQQMIRDKSSSA
jgi:hypothetical protein